MSAARGTVIKRGAKWYVVLDHGRDETGRRIRHWHSGYSTRQDAERARTELLRARDTAVYVAPTRTTVAGFVEERWLPALDAAVAAGRLKPATVSQYRNLVRSYVVPALGSVLLRDLTPDQLTRHYGQLLVSGRRRGGGPLSATTVHAVHVCVHRMLKDAGRWGLVARNVADVAGADAPHPVRREMAERSWSPDQLRAFLSANAGHRLYGLWLLAATTGMRRGELCGLRWTQVDLEAGRLSVARTRVVVNHVVHESTPKTASSARSIGLDAATVRALRAHKAAQAAERLAWGPEYQATDLLFVWEDGRPLHPDLVTRTFQRLAGQSGLRAIPFHGLRHSYASAALEAGGIDVKVVSGRLGHASVAITADLYQHVRPQVDQQAADKVAALILG